MALLYDQADPAASSLSIKRLMQTSRSEWGPIWARSKQPVVVDVSRMSLKWYLSGATAGVPAGNFQTPFALAYAAQSSATSTNLGRIMVQYVVEFIEPVDPTVNS
jgi:hypothetical protein